MLNYFGPLFLLKRFSLTVLTLLFGLVALAACGDPTATPAPASSNLAVPTANLASNPTAAATTAAATTVAANTAAASGNPIKVRISFPGEKNTGNGQMAVKFADLVTKKTGGRVDFEFYPNSSIAGGDQLTAVNMVQANKIEAVISQTSFFTTIDPNIELLNYPFLFASRPDAFRFLDSDIGKELIKGLEQYNFKTLAINDQGFRQISNSKRAVSNPADLSGLRIRIPQSNLYTKVLKALGAEPVTMNFSPELYKALETKTLDGQDAPIMFSLTNKYHQVLPYMTMVNYSWDPLLLNFSQTFWKSLPADIQNAMLEAGTEVTKTLNAALDDSEKTALEQFRSAGVQVVELSPAQRQAFLSVTQPIYAAAESQFGKQLLDRVLKAAQS